MIDKDKHMNAVKLILLSTIHTLVHKTKGFFAVQLVAFAVMGVLVLPMFTFGIGLIQRFASISAFTPNNMPKVLANPPSMMVILLMGYLLSIIMIFEVHFILSFYAKKKDLLTVLSMAFNKLIRISLKDHLKVVITVWLMMVSANLPAIYFIFRKYRFLRYLADELSTPFVASATFIVFIMVGVFLLSRKFNGFSTFFSAPDLIGENRNRFIKSYLIWNAMLAVGILILYVMVVGVALALSLQIPEKQVAIANFVSLIDNLDRYLLILMGFIGIIGNCALMVASYERIYGRQADVPAEVFHYHGKLLKHPLIKKSFVILVALVALFMIYISVDMIKDGSRLRTAIFSDAQITAHRGFSDQYPENSVLAVVRAIEELSDHVEVDVRMTQDGELVLLHDASLKRTLGIDQMIWDTNYYEIQHLVPKLSEIFELAKGHVVLNIDLKHTGYQEDMVQRLVTLIEENDMVYQCVVTSTHLDALKEIKSLNPEIQTGYITYQLTQAALSSEAVDVFSMKSTLVNKTVVETIHREGKQIYVWTVNKRKEMERLNRLGVDNIITDNPVFAREVLFETGGDQLLVILLRVAFN